MNLAQYLISSAASAIIVCGFACGAPAFAQDQSAPPAATPPAATAPEAAADTSSQKQLNVAAARAERKAVVGQNMALTDDESRKFWPLYDEYEGKMDRIEDRHVIEIKEFARHFQNLTNADARKKLNEVMAISQSRLNVQSTYIPKFRAILSDVKVTRFFQIDNKLRALVQCQIAQIVPLAQPSATSESPGGNPGNNM
jgi:hypothetical protein